MRYGCRCDRLIWFNDNRNIDGVGYRTGASDDGGDGRKDEPESVADSSLSGIYNMQMLSNAK